MNKKIESDKCDCSKNSRIEIIKLKEKIKYLEEKNNNYFFILNSLMEIGLAQSSLSLRDTLQTIVDQAPKMLGYQKDLGSMSCYLLLLDGELIKEYYISSKGMESPIKQNFINKDITNSSYSFGISGEVIKSGHLINSKNVLEHTSYLPLDETVSSQLSVPLRINSASIGVLTVTCQTNNAFSKEDENLLSLLSSLAATIVAIDKLHKTTISLSRQKNKQLLYSTILNEAMHLLQGRVGGLYVFHEDKQELELVAEYGQQEALGNILKVGEGVAGYLVESNDPYIIVPDYSTWDKRSARYAKNRPYDCVMGMLLKGSDGSIIGSFSFDVDVKRGFTNSDAEFLQRFVADQALIVWDRIDLFESQINTIGEIARTISSPSLKELENLLDSIIDFCVSLINEESTLLIIKFAEDDEYFQKQIIQYRPSNIDYPNEYLKSNLIKQLIRDKETIVKNNYEPEGQYLPLSNNPQSILLVPMLRNEFLMGVFIVENPNPEAFTDSEIEIIEAVTKLAVAAIDINEFDKKKTEALYIVGHQIGNPLARAMAGVFKLLEFSELTDDQIDVLERARHNLEHVHDQLLTIKEYTGYSLHKQILDLKEVNIVEEIKNMLPTYEHDAKKHGLEFEGIFPEDTILLLVDIKKIMQALQNIIENAIKFTTEGKVSVLIKKTNNYVEIRVADTGIGISGQHIDKIWSPNYQVDSSTTREFEGFGLGLSIAKKAVKLHPDSYINVSSEINKGSEFSIFIKIQDEMEENNEKK